MKKFLFSTLILVVLSLQVQAQFVLINSPSELEGSYVFGEAAQFGRAVTDSVWTEDVAFIEDATAMPNEGCEAAVNAADVAGKIALVDRGSCAFVLKAQNAQAAGAVAIVILNHTAGAGVIPMGGTATDVTIPVVMLSFEDGQAIRAAMAAGETVNMTIGDVRFDNNIGISVGTVLNAPQGTMELSQLEGETTFDNVLTPGALITNLGLNDASGISLTATVNHTFDGTTTEVYQESAMLDETLMTDSTGLVTLTDFDPATIGVGQYEVTYEISSNEGDEVMSDNTLTTSFSVVEGAMARGRWDFENNRPLSTAGRTIGGGGPVQFVSPFHFPKGLGFQMDSVNFQTSVNTPATLAGESYEVIIYDWVDASEDGVINNDEMEVVGYGVHEFAADETASSTTVTVPIIDFDSLEDPSYVIPEDDKTYFVTVRYSGANIVFFGFDDGYDLTEYVALPTTVNEAALPYFVTNDFLELLPDIEDNGGLFTDVTTPLAMGLYISEVVSSNKDILEDEVAISLFPNPVADQLVSKVTLEEKAKQVEYQIMDVNGKILVRTQQENIQTQEQTFDVSQLPAGQYFFNVQLEAGSKSLPFVIQR